MTNYEKKRETSLNSRINEMQDKNVVFTTREDFTPDEEKPLEPDYISRDLIRFVRKGNNIFFGAAGRNKNNAKVFSETKRMEVFLNYLEMNRNCPLAIIK